MHKCVTKLPAASLLSILLVVLVALVGCSGSSSTPDNNDQSGDTPGNGQQPNDDVSAVEPDISDTGILNGDNANDVILQAFDVLTGRAYDRRLTAFPYVRAVDVDGRTQYLSRECRNAGVVVESQSEVDSQFLNETVYSDCQIGGDVINGRVLLGTENYGCCEFQRTFLDDFSLVFEPGGTMTVSGNYSYLSIVNYKNLLAVRDLDYYFSYPYGTLVVSDASTERSFRFDGSSDEGNRFSYMTGSFSMMSPVLAGGSIDVAVTRDFVNSSAISQLAYEQGRMTITAADSAIVLDANTEDLQTVSVSITTPTGHTETVIEKWSAWRAALSFQPPWLTEVEPDIPADGDGYTIGPENIKDVLMDVFSVYSGERFGREILALPGYPVPEFPWQYFAENPGDGLGDPIVQSCEGGGNAVLTPYKSGDRQVTSGWNFDFSNCRQGSSRYDGAFETREFGNFIYRSTGLTTESDTTTTEFSGEIDYKHTSNRDGGPTRYFRLSDVSFQMRQANSDDVLTDATFSYDYVYPYLATLNGGFSLKSTATGNVLVNVNTADPLIRPTVGDIPDTEMPLYYFQSGLLVIDAGDNNSVLIDPSGGDENSFSVTLTRPDHQPVTQIERWEDWGEYLDFNFDLYPD